MRNIISPIIFGLTILLIGTAQVHAVEQDWHVETAGWPATFTLEIQNDGTVTGRSDWHGAERVNLF